MKKLLTLSLLAVFASTNIQAILSKWKSQNPDKYAHLKDKEGFLKIKKVQ